MYIGNNQIALDSQMFFSEALFYLMKTKPYNKITIKEICTKAGLSRMTFYNLFNDKDEIITFYLKDKFDESLIALESTHSFKINDMSIIVTKYLNENQGIFKLLYDNKLDSIISYSISICISYFIDQMIPSLNNKELKYVNAFLSGAISNIIIYWLRDGISVSSSELSHIMFEIFSGNYYEQMKDLIELE